MCSICGVYGFEDKNLLKKMCGVTIHRGPDDHGFFFDKDISLGHRRLSIIDLKTGHQPIHNEDESIWIVYNGEIYNFRELRAQLEKTGHRFYTSSDTEVIIHAYEEFGELFVRKLRGMFAFAVWDRNEKKLLLARDRLGIKPLYYTLSGTNLLFASEIKSLLQYDGVVREVDLSSLRNFLVFRYVPSPKTMFKGIKKLQPGHILTCCQGGTPRTQKYWDLEMNVQCDKNEEYFAKHIISRLKESVEMRLVSDVPLGAYLSGGIDSSLVVGLMSSLLDEPVKTFSVGFGMGEPVDELRYAQIVADHFGTDHRELLVEPNAAKLLPKLVWHMDEPLGDPAIIPTYLMSELTRKYVTVILTGEGGDELFAGYFDRYGLMLRKERLARYYSKLPRFVGLKLAPNLANAIPIPLGYKRRIERIVASREENGYLDWIFFNSREWEKELYSEGMLNTTEGISPTNIVKPHFEKSNDFLNQVLYVDIETGLPDDLLMKVDKTTMANSLEARVPFLDHKFVEFSMSMPSKFKLKNRIEKYILRKAASKILPKSILERKKHGFSVPLDTWFRGEFKEIVMQILSENEILKRGYFRYDFIEKILRNPRENYQLLFNLICLELWFKIYIDRDMSPLRSM